MQNDTKTELNIRDLFSTEYKKLGEMLNILERQLIILLNNQKASTQEGDKDTYQKLREFLADLFAKVAHLEDYTHKGIELLDQAVRLPYRLEIIRSYCLFFIGHHILDNLEGKKQELQGDWFKVSDNFRKLFQIPLMVNSVHSNPRIELFFGQTLFLMLREMMFQRLFLTDTLEKARYLRIYATFETYFHNIAVNPLRKAQCLAIKFMHEQFDECANVLEVFLPEDAHYYKKEILAQLKEGNDRLRILLRHFATATVMHHSLTLLQQKLEESKTLRSKLYKKNSGIYIPKNICSYIQEVSLIINAEELKNVLSLLNGYAHDHTIKHVLFDRICQDKDLLAYLLDIYRKCLVGAVDILATVISATKDPGPQWDRHLDALKKAKEYLLLIRDVDNIIAVNDNEPARTSSVILDQLALYSAELEEAEKLLEESDKNLNSLLAENIDKNTNKVIAKIHKQRKLRSDYQEFNATSAKSREGNALEILLAEANRFVQEGDFQNSLARYQQALKHPEISILQTCQTHIALGDLYNNLTKQLRNQKNRAALQTKAQENYQAAVNKLQKELTASNENKALPELRTLLEMAQSFIKEHESDQHTDQSLSHELPNKQPTTRDISSLQPPPQYKSVHREIPLPDVFKRLYQLLKENGFGLVIGGGFIRDYLLGEVAFDIDCLVYNPKENCDVKGLLTSIYQLLKKHFPFCELRSKKYPIIFVQQDGVIIELSNLRIDSDLCYNQRSFGHQFITTLYHDVKHRDTTDNALIYDIEKARILDFFNGFEDIQNNVLRSIQAPDVSFEEDATRIFRVLRAIIRRSIRRPNLHYSPKILEAMQIYAGKLRSLNKDRCYSEIKKILFRGNALPTWRFLLNVGLENYLFILPSEEHNNLKQRILNARLLAKLDTRINGKLPYNEALCFAGLFWGKLCESLEAIPKANITAATVSELGFKIFADEQSIFRLHDVTLIARIIKIWQVHLATTNYIPRMNFSFTEYRLAKVLARLITHSANALPYEKVRTLLAESSMFWKHHRFEFILKETIKQYSVKLQCNDLRFTLSIEPSNRILLDQNMGSLLQDLKRKLQLVLGKFAIRYELNSKGLTLSSESVHKRALIAQLMEFLFDDNIKDKLHIASIKHS